MKIKLQHTPYISQKIARDLLRCDFIEVRKDKDSIVQEIERIIDEDIENENALDEKVNAILDNKESDIEFYQADYKQLFWMAKKRMANEHGVILSQEDRFSDIAHKIIDFLWEEDYIHFTVSDNQVKNIIVSSFEEFVKGFEEADKTVYEKIKNYKRKLIPGSEDYQLVYNRLYEEELGKRGLL
ncbi:MAG: DUF507 family protein [Arcobacter butzleri]|jgi:hypothetical protein|nr:DUF507 family protein [Arcobacteraceae bacterium]MDY0365632.1 DUF507 family protein [Arcobacteraceae bacterium]NLO17619.1 DUF507 family protein [Aliarcobacter butzleri]